MSSRARTNSSKGGFTLVEVVVATVIGAMIAVTAVAALRGVTVGREKLTVITTASSEANYAANMVRSDFENIYRDRIAGSMKLEGMVEEGAGPAASRAIFYAVSPAKARRQSPEGDVYEIEYFVTAGQDKMSLCRRIWPNPSEDLEPAGVVTTVAEDLVSFEVRYFDGQNWQWEWPKGQNLPDMIEVKLAVKGERADEPVRRSIIVNLKLLQQRPEGMEALEQADDSEQAETAI